MSAGTGLMVYAIGAFFVILLLFGLCTAADAMGRGAIKMFQRFAFADGSGNVSLLTEIVVFIVVLIIAGVLLAHAFNTTVVNYASSVNCQAPLDATDAT